jgi:hypothetical protein
VGDDGVIRFFDPGMWYLDNGATEQPLRSIWASPQGPIFAVGYRGTLVEYVNGSWLNIPFPTTEDLYLVTGFSDQDLLLCGSENTLARFDGQALTPITVPDGQGCHDIWGHSPDDFYLLSYVDVLHYESGNWTTEATGSPYVLYGLWVAPNGEQFAVGYRGAIVHRGTGGWVVQDADTYPPLYDVWGSAHDDVYAVGVSGTVLHWDGTTWSEIDVPTHNHLGTVWGSGPNDIWVAGDNYRVLLHFDGETWELLQTDDLPRFNALHGRSRGTVYVAGDEGSVTKFHLGLCQ